MMAPFGIGMKNDFGIAMAYKLMAFGKQFFFNTMVIINFTIKRDVKLLIMLGLATGITQVYNTKPSMAQANGSSRRLVQCITFAIGAPKRHRAVHLF